MTGQIHDTVSYQHEPYELVGVHGARLIMPEKFGMTLAPLSTACWHGFFTKYIIEGSFLLDYIF